ncbi:branched-chain amino acid ABC transporter permease [Pararhodobacter aggregans]|uniref:Branched-chain amino acid ABC transporter permease n=1 Tax=Pararhodobacter aggregans TaxID=404875 RepID=A0A2T7UP16_9RHOB|nr:branched-chain amino acid ABC transporter permease [Pararhodobacter aggregans]PTX00880.1 amino acid/amide ABC transporter membrane protein 2 (HAAT family) [Pararhodobacter aggregans]PVE46404.1 branched-chain amino acid ABC transporter permease [Pararhodobacter aggregans]
MLYREAGDFKTSYASDNQTFPIRFDRYAYWVVMAVAFLVLPMVMNDYWANSIVVPFMIYVIAALGLNILIGYTGLLSLGTAAFMAVGAYATFKLTTAFPAMPIYLVFLLSGLVTSAVGVLFGLPSLKIKGFYLAVATLAAQFFLIWLFTRYGWFFNYSSTGQISMPERSMFGVTITGATASSTAVYFTCLIFTVAMAWLARNLTRGQMGRTWMAIRDMDIAAEIIGVNPLIAKLSSFAVSSFFVGVAGALMFGVYLGAVEAGEAFGINKSFLVLFMVIIGGLGSILGSFLGAAFLVVLPVLLKILLVDNLGWPADLARHLEIMIIGALIIVVLIAEPHGMAALWRTIKDKLRLWPFPH